MHRPQGIGPPLPGEACKGLTHLDPEQGVLDPALGLVHVALGRDHVVIAREDHRRLGGNELCGVSEQSLEPAQLVVELDRKSTRLNSSHRTISYAVFCLKKKKNEIQE